jgi:hypothetical protein
VNGRIACGSMVRFISFFTKMLHNVQHFCEKETISSALPEANRAIRPGEHLIWNRPRNACRGAADAQKRVPMEGEAW